MADWVKILGDSVLHVPVTLGATATIETLLGLTLNAKLKGVTFICSAAGAFFAVGPATNASAPLPAALSLRIQPSTLRTWQFYGTGQSLTVIEEY
jgi:hypothetical protein